MKWLGKWGTAVRWRITQLALLSIALAGPWVYEKIHVPAAYPCSPPSIRLEGDFCGLPMSGFAILAFAGEGIYHIAAGVASDPASPAGRLSELRWIGLMLALALPLFAPLSAFGPSGRGVDDFFAVQIDGTTLFTANATQLSQYDSYKLVTINANAFANGAPYAVRLTSTTIGHLVNIHVDDVSLSCS